MEGQRDFKSAGGGIQTFATRLADPPADAAKSGWIRFRHYEISPGARLLLADGQPVELGGRAFDVLVVLLRSRGTIVSKSELFKHVWPATIVEESNLRFQIATLRAALGKDRDAIKTVSGRGYLLVEDVTEASSDVRAVSTAEAPASPVAEPEMAHPAVVAIIEDDEGICEALEGLLLSTGLQARTFGSVEAFLATSDTVSPACVILDVWLPGMSGIDFFESLAREGCPPPVIFISGHADVHMSVRAMKAGAMEFLTKPVRHQDLLDAIHAAVARPQ